MSRRKRDHLPNDPHAELSVIGGAFIDPSVVHAVDLPQEAFYNPRNRAMWAAVLTVHAEGAPIDVVTVCNALDAAGNLQAVGGVAGLSDAVIACPTAANAAHYADIIRAHWVRRQLAVAASEVLERCRHGLDIPVDDLLGEASRAIVGVSTGQPATSRGWVSLLADFTGDLDRRYAALQRGEVAVDGAPLGVGGVVFPWATLSIVAARPGMGKSSVAKQAAIQSCRDGTPVHLVSLEDAPNRFVARAVASESGLPTDRVVSGTWQRGEMDRMRPAMARLRELRGLHWHDLSRPTAEQIVRSVMRVARKTGERHLVLVDYAQLVKGPPGIDKRHYQLDAIASEFAGAAKTTGDAYVLFSQLNRAVESRQDRRPQLSDLRDSGALEEHGKYILGLYRGAYYSDKPIAGIDWDPDARPPEGMPMPDVFSKQMQLITLKNNFGPLGRRIVEFDGPTTRIRDR